MKITSLSLLAALALGVSTSAAADTVIVQEDFSGAGAALNGTSSEVFDADITTAGGSATWVASTTFLDNGLVNGVAGNSSAYLNLGSYINSTKGTSEGIFELTMTIGDVTGTGNAWFSLGFSALTSPSTSNHFLDTAVTASTGTVILRERNSGELDFWAGTGNANSSQGPTGASGARTLTVTVDLSTHNGTTDFGSVTWSDSLLGDVGSHSYSTDTDFTSILFSEPSTTTATLSNLTLTQVPEPGSLALLGLGGVMIARRRRQS
ncbi:MAG: PEP-CTERM sorting domain-containing protein [Phycisphaeraceae bacterium]|nr:PEP-CTERM sorting domain-containing protein [Phycisphaeraceae bacterium]